MTPVSSRIRWCAAIGCAWNCLCIAQVLPTLLLASSLRSLIQSAPLQDELKQQGHSTELILHQFDFSVIINGTDAALRLLLVFSLCWSLLGHRSARWLNLSAGFLVLGLTLAWTSDWYVIVMDIGLIGTLIWAQFWPESAAVSQQRIRCRKPRVIAIPTDFPAEF